jgi:hypothetical protein
LNEASNRDYFAQANWSLGERYTLTTGVRQSNVTLKSRDDMTTGTDGSGSVNYSATSPVLGLTWHAQDNLNLYVNQGKGFETPTMAEAAYSGTSALKSSTPTCLPHAASIWKLAANGCQPQARDWMLHGFALTQTMKLCLPTQAVAKLRIPMRHKPSVMVLNSRYANSTIRTGAAKLRLRS